MFRPVVAVGISTPPLLSALNRLRDDGPADPIEPGTRARIRKVASYVPPCGCRSTILAYHLSQMKIHHDGVGGGGSNAVAQVQAQHCAIGKAMSGVRYRLAVGSGKGVVGRSTLTMAVARALRRRGWGVAREIL